MCSCVALIFWLACLIEGYNIRENCVRVESKIGTDSLAANSHFSHRGDHYTNKPQSWHLLDSLHHRAFFAQPPCESTSTIETRQSHAQLLTQHSHWTQNRQESTHTQWRALQHQEQPLQDGISQCQASTHINPHLSIDGAPSC